MSEDNKTCRQCKKDKPTEDFKFFRGKYNKTCLNCLDIAKKSKEKNKCEHNREKSKCKECGGASICEHKRIKSICKECGGASICEHNREKSKCKECGGASICEHNREKSKCKECGGGSICEHKRIKSTCKECNDPIKITINNWIKSSKQNDIKYNRYKNENYITEEACQELINFYKHCYHCSIILQYTHYRDDLASIERLNNDIEHNINNCVLACLKCNKKKLTK